MEEGLRNKVEGFRTKAEFFKEKKLRAFISDLGKTFYFCEILEVDDVRIVVYNFAGKRKGETDRILLVDIYEFKEYVAQGVGQC
jgi:hypothetical protein